MKNQINSIEIIISIFCIILLLGGCKKDDNKISYTFTGRLVDYYSGNGVANAMIYIKTTEVNPSRPQKAQLDLFDTTSFEDKILSDSEGFFNKIIEIDKGTIKAIVYDKNYISVDTIYSNNEVQYNPIIKVKKFKTLFISLKNINNTADSLMVLVNSNDQISQSYIIKAIDTQIVYNEAIPETKCSVHYRIIKNGIFQTDKYESKEISIFGIDSIDIAF